MVFCYMTAVFADPRVGSFGAGLQTYQESITSSISPAQQCFAKRYQLRIYPSEPLPVFSDGDLFSDEEEPSTWDGRSHF
jgi:hypothetical protein